MRRHFSFSSQNTALYQTLSQRLMKACARSRWCCCEPLSVSKAVFILQEAQQKRAPFRLLFGGASVNNPSGPNCPLFQTRLYVHTHHSEIELEILGWQVECWISREMLLSGYVVGPVQSFTTNCHPRHRWETLTTVHQILKPMDVLTCMKGRQGHCEVLHSNICL